MASLDPMKAVCPGPAVDSFEFDSGSALAPTPLPAMSST